MIWFVTLNISVCSMPCHLLFGSCLRWVVESPDPSYRIGRFPVKKILLFPYRHSDNVDELSHQLQTGSTIGLKSRSKLGRMLWIWPKILTNQQFWHCIPDSVNIRVRIISD